MARRRFQRGQLTRDGERWVGRWREDVELPDGTVKRVRRWDVIAPTKGVTKPMAERLLAERLNEVNREDYRPEWAGTFALFAEKWEKTILPQHKPSSQPSERSVIKVHLKPAWGGHRLRDITTEALQAWIAGKRGSVGPKTIHNLVRTLRSMWATAKDWGYVREDPFAGLVLPEVPKGNTYSFTVEEAIAIIQKAEGKWKLFFRILFETGMRPGELAGLKSENCHLRSLRVSQSVWARKVQTVKSRAAVRSFAISERLGRDLDEFIRGAEPNEYGLLFVTEKWRVRANQHGRQTRINQHEGGKPLSMDSFRQRVLDPILDQLGIRARVKAMGIRCGNYAFRHLNATQMDTWGTPLKTRQKRLGHADPKVTLEHYTHAIDADDMRVADLFGALLEPKSGPVQ
jgi:integrase